MYRLTLTALAIAAITGCAATPGEARPSGLAQYEGDPRLGEETNKICFASSIDGFSMNDRKSVLLHDGSKRYMVEVTGSCLDLDNAESIALDNTTSCLTRGDSIIIAQTFGQSIGSRRCMITEMHLWDPKAEKPAAAAEENPG